MLRVEAPSLPRLLTGVVILLSILQVEVLGVVQKATPLNSSSQGTKEGQARQQRIEEAYEAVTNLQKALDAAGNYDVILALMNSGGSSGAYTYVSYMQSVLSIPIPMTLFLPDDDAWKNLTSSVRSKILGLRPQDLVRFLQFSTLKSSAYTPSKLASFPKGRYFGTADLNILVKVSKAKTEPAQLSPLGKGSNTVDVASQLFQATGLSALQVSDFLLPPGW